MACRRRSLEAVALLLLASSQTVSVNDVEPLSGRTALYVAVWTNPSPWFLVQEGADSNVKDRGGNTPIHEYVIQQPCQTDPWAAAAPTMAGHRRPHSVL